MLKIVTVNLNIRKGFIQIVQYYSYFVNNVEVLYRNGMSPVKFTRKKKGNKRVSKNTSLYLIPDIHPASFNLNRYLVYRIFATNSRTILSEICLPVCHWMNEWNVRFCLHIHYETAVNRIVKWRGCNDYKFEYQALQKLYRNNLGNNCDSVIWIMVIPSTQCLWFGSAFN